MDSQTFIDDSESILLAQAYKLILSWPCPICGQPFPCPHDVANGQDNAPQTEAELRQSLMIEPPSASPVKLSKVTEPTE